MASDTDESTGGEDGAVVKNKWDPKRFKRSTIAGIVVAVVVVVGVLLFVFFIFFMWLGLASESVL